MNNFKKTLVLFACAVLLVVGSIFGTLAYLTDTETVTNTFTVGNVGLTLDEAKVDDMGDVLKYDETEKSYVKVAKVDGESIADYIAKGDRVKENSYHLLPGHTYVKDPTVTVDANSEESYVRMMVKVENIDQLKLAFTDAQYYGTDGVFLLQLLCLDDDNGVCTWDSTKWLMKNYTESTSSTTDEATQDTTTVTTGTYEFRYYQTVAKSDSATKLPALFTHITVPGTVDNDSLALLNTVQIKVTAHAIQADGFADADAAWAAFKTN